VKCETRRSRQRDMIEVIIGNGEIERVGPNLRWSKEARVVERLLLEKSLLHQSLLLLLLLFQPMILHFPLLFSFSEQFFPGKWVSVEIRVQRVPNNGPSQSTGLRKTRGLYSIPIHHYLYTIIFFFLFFSIAY